ncbi:MAG: winged helix-turn-helix domain-containing protein [Tabrizicola sp.]|nr:winged helix-turn-helix domain-containing protein [Tabrizicola sp.]
MDIQFGNFRLNDSSRHLLAPDGPVPLSARSFDILVLLLAKPDAVISKSALLEAVWPGLVVEDNTLQVHISALRKTLGDGMIMTVHGRGYKYTGPPPVNLEASANTLGSDTASERTAHPMLDLSGGKKVPVTGGCLCGDVRFRVTGPVLDTNICHCRMCQKFTGAPIAAGSVYACDAVQITRGEPKYYRSSPFAERGFCAACGSSMFFRPLMPPVSADWENWILIYTATLDNPAPNAPTWQLGVESQMPWIDLPQPAKRLRSQECPDIVEAWTAFNLPVP